MKWEVLRFPLLTTSPPLATSLSPPSLQFYVPGEELIVGEGGAYSLGWVVGRPLPLQVRALDEVGALDVDLDCVVVSDRPPSLPPDCNPSTSPFRSPSPPGQPPLDPPPPPTQPTCPHPLPHPTPMPLVCPWVE